MFKYLKDFEISKIYQDPTAVKFFENARRNQVFWIQKNICITYQDSTPVQKYG